MSHLYKFFQAILVVAMVVFMCQSCIEPFTPNTEIYEDAIVIEGRVLEGKIPAVIKISRTFPFEEKEPEYVKNAQVQITDDLGVSYLLQENGDGFYESDTNRLIGTPGRSYQLEVKIPSGQTFESDWKKMKKGRPIEDIYANFEEKIVEFDTLTGMQVYVSASDPENNTRFYQWGYEETWTYRVPFPATGVWDLATQTPIINQDSLPWTCYSFFENSEILIGTSQGLEKDILKDQRIKYIDTRGNELRRRYSILVKQYSIDEQTYAFWKNVRAVNEDLGTLFDPIPTEVLGNIQNVNDPDLPVLGYFSADGFDQKRIFIDRLDFTPDVIVPSEYGDCELLSFATPSDMSRHIRSGGVFVARIADMQGNIVGYTGSSLYCADCRVVKNGTTKIPDFWR